MTRTALYQPSHRFTSDSLCALSQIAFEAEACELDPDPSDLCRADHEREGEETDRKQDPEFRKPPPSVDEHHPDAGHWHDQARVAAPENARSLVSWLAEASSFVLREMLECFLKLLLEEAVDCCELIADPPKIGPHRRWSGDLSIEDERPNLMQVDHNGGKAGQQGL